MSKYNIHIRREKNEIGISITNIKTSEIIYKNSFLCDINYDNEPEFKTIQKVFLEYINGNCDITFTDNERTRMLYYKLLGKQAVSFKDIIEDEKTNRVKYIGVDKYDYVCKK